MSRIEELSVVRTKVDFAPDPANTRVIPAGTQGTVVHVYEHRDDTPDSMEVEFSDPFGLGEPDVIPMPDSILEIAPALSNMPVTDFLPVREVMPIVTGYQMKFCCQKCGNRWNAILPNATDMSECDRCGERNLLPYNVCSVDNLPSDLGLQPAPPVADITDKILAELNSALAADPAAISLLFGIRVPCNAVLANHPTVQVLAPPQAGFTVGAMGIVNALVAAATGVTPEQHNGNGIIALEWDIESATVKRFLRFPKTGVVELGTSIIM